MKVLVYTPLGTFQSASVPLQPMDRQAAQNTMANTVAQGKQLLLMTSDHDYFIIPAALLQQSVIAVEGVDETPAESAEMPGAAEDLH